MPNNMDAVIATSLNNNLKSCVTSCAKSATEAVTPEIRRTFAEISQEGIRRQEALVRVMEEKGWYRAPFAEAETIRTLMPQLTTLTAGLDAAAPGIVE